MTDLREALEKVRQRLRADYCLNRLPKTKERQEILDMLDAALSAPPEQPPEGMTAEKWQEHLDYYAGLTREQLIAELHYLGEAYVELPKLIRKEAIPTETESRHAVPVARSGVESGSGHTDDYVAWLRWVGDEEHRHLVVCDSDSPGAFKVYRRPND